jgi:hypothetical protein
MNGIDKKIRGEVVGDACAVFGFQNQKFSITDNWGSFKTPLSSLLKYLCLTRHNSREKSPFR